MTGAEDEPSQAGAGYWSILEPVWEVIDIYNGPARFLETYMSVPSVQRTLFAAHFCESEVSNGGFHQFFSNPTGVLAPEAVEAFNRIGMDTAASIIEQAMAFFGKAYPRQQEVRCVRLDAIPGKSREEWDPFFKLDDRFYVALGPQHAAFFDALDRYALSRI